MLTGTLPFVGSSAAELTLLHLNNEPDLMLLTAADRYAVSRALAKDPQHRYATCREFVDGLIKAAESNSFADGPAPAAPFDRATDTIDPKSRETQPADVFDDDQPADCNAATSRMLLELPESDCTLVDLPPVNLAGLDARPAPTLLLGIGGTAARVLAHFRRMLSDQWGSAREIPSVQFLLVDTDSRELTETARDESNGVMADEVLNLPLRRPQHYRENSQQLLHWLSRRWLYNIPRSLRTEGLRPLGRLALADHARPAGQRIRRAMVQALDPASLAKSSATVNQAFRADAMRVIVVASISGGTGGGMSLDVGYAVRAILQKLGLAQAQIFGLMMHSTGRDARHNELARVNAFSWLTEYHHFQQFENPYPGDVSCGFPAHAAGVPAFDFTYLVHLGEYLDGGEFDQATQAVAEYIRLNTLSPASAFFDACRMHLSTPHATAAAASAHLRSFGVHHYLPASTEFNDEFARAVSQHVLSIWRGTAASAGTNDAETNGIQLVQRLQLGATEIAANARSLIEVELGMEPAAFLAGWLKDQASTSTSAAATNLESIDQVFGRGSNEPGCDVSLLGRTPAVIVAPLAEKLGMEVRRWISRHIDEPRHRLGGARRALTWVSEHFSRVERELQRIRGSLADRLIQIRADVAVAATKGTNKTAGASSASNPSCADEYFHMSLDQLTILAAEHAVRVIQADVKGLSDEITSLGREIDQIAAAVGRSATTGATAADVARIDSPAPARGKLAVDFRDKLPEVAAQVDARLQAEYIEANGGLMKTIMHGGRPRAQLSAKLHELSRKSVQLAIATANSRSGIGRQVDENGLQAALAMATPAFLEYGGRRRVLVVQPGESPTHSEATILPSLGAAVTAVRGRENQLTICVEADGVSLQHVALDFVERRRDRVEFAGRVHSRTDIAWTPLVPDVAPSGAANWSDATPQSQSQQDMCKTLVM
jgi:hypothetical protein